MPQECPTSGPGQVDVGVPPHACSQVYGILRELHSSKRNERPKAERRNGSGVREGAGMTSHQQSPSCLEWASWRANGKIVEVDPALDTPSPSGRGPGPLRQAPKQVMKVEAHRSPLEVSHSDDDGSSGPAELVGGSDEPEPEASSASSSEVNIEESENNRWQ